MPLIERNLRRGAVEAAGKDEGARPLAAERALETLGDGRCALRPPR